MSKKKSILERCGGEENLALIVAQFYQYALADDRFNSFWLENVSDIPKLHDTVTLYMIGKFGGPNNYKGPDMYNLHKNMAIQQKHFEMYWDHLTRALR
jgi:truncated hemoglobin YjbI